MKKNIIASSVIALGLFGGMTQASAANFDAKTDAEVKFKAPDSNADGSVVGPGGETPIHPDGGTGTKGPLRIEHVSAINFGEQVISSQEKVYKALWSTYQEDDGKGGATGNAIKMPHFAQVVDERGTLGNFELSVKQTSPFEGKLATSANLANTRVEFTEASYFVTNSTTPSDLVEGLPTTIGEATPTQISTTASVTILKSKTGKTIDGKKASVVFNKDYETALPWGATSATGDTNSGVQLRVPSTDVKVATETYTAELTWTLTDGI